MPTPEALPGDRARFRLVLFDLDGTFADTAPDLAYALNQTLERHGRAAIAFEHIRPQVSHGGAALIRLGFQIEPGHAAFEGYRQELLDCYQQNLSRHTSLFPGMEDLLEQMEKHGILWGIVTNKPAWLTDPLMEQLGFTGRAACIISGDTTENRKPHPGPILHACQMLDIAPGEALYVGDAQRDIEAGSRAGSATLAALFGYIGETDQPGQWGANGSIDHPLQILGWLGLDLPTGHSGREELATFQSLPEPL
jgi:phosphoglycolate phosphatase